MSRDPCTRHPTCGNYEELFKTNRIKFHTRLFLLGHADAVCCQVPPKYPGDRTIFDRSSGGSRITQGGSTNSGGSRITQGGSTNSGGSRISPRRGCQLRGAPINDFAKISPKLHEIERIWTPKGGTRVPRPP